MQPLIPMALQTFLFEKQEIQLLAYDRTFDGKP
jgi:hypothetical protein